METKVADCNFYFGLKHLENTQSFCLPGQSAQLYRQLFFFITHLNFRVWILVEDNIQVF